VSCERPGHKNDKIYMERRTGTATPMLLEINKNNVGVAIPPLKNAIISQLNKPLAKRTTL
jgi:hypothetical protein